VSDLPPGRISIFGCGVQKAGTTSLHAYLGAHAALSAPCPKETHFFDDETRDWRAPRYADLERFYAPDDGGRLRFDMTPIYAFWPPVMARLQAYNPAARLIFVFRDPFERAWSQWCMDFFAGRETMPFAAAIREGRRRMDGQPPLAPAYRMCTYLERGFYGVQVRRALAHFPREQMLFLRSEDLRADHGAVLVRVADFLGIAPFPELPPRRERSQPVIPDVVPPTEVDRALAAALLAEDLADFSSLTGVDVSAWPTMR
jgi:hypothetical protein